MVPFEYGAVCLSDCFMYLCKKIRFVSQRIFVSAQFLYNCCSLRRSGAFLFLVFSPAFLFLFFSFSYQPFPVEEISKEGNLHITWLRRPIVKIFVITGRFSAVITHGIIGSDSLKIHGDVFFDVAVIHVLDLKDDAFAKLVVSEPIPDILGRVSGFWYPAVLLVEIC